MDVTQGTLLGGRLRYTQPQNGYRTGIEPVLLAAAIPATPGQRVLEAGTGAGAGLLCLAARVPGLNAIGLEREAAMAALARQNAADNGLAVEIVTADVADAARLGRFDHVFANPPWHDPAGTRPPDSLRSAATHATESGLLPWIVALSEALGPQATLTLILPASRTGEAIQLLLARGLGRIAVLPLWPHSGQAAKITLLQARPGRPCTILAAGLVLHAPAGGYTEAADNILRHGEAFTPGLRG